MVAPDAGLAGADGYAYRPTPVIGDTAQVTSDVSVEWDFDNDGDYDETVEDITSYVTGGQWRVGRDYPSQLLGRSTPGRLTLTLDNSDNRFSTHLTTSPLNQEDFSLQVGRRIRVRTTESSPTDPAVLCRERFGGGTALDRSHTGNGLEWSTRSGTFARSARSAVATEPSTVAIATVDLAAADYYLQARVGHVDVDNLAGLVVRWADSSNYEAFLLSEADAGLIYRAVVAGVATDSAVTSVDLRSDMALGVLTDGATASVYIDGVWVADYAMEAGQTSETEAGIYVDWQTQRAPAFDEFMAWTSLRSPQEGVLFTGTVTSLAASRDEAKRKTANLVAEGDLARLDREVSMPSSVGAVDGIAVGVGAGMAIGSILGDVGMMNPPLPLDRGVETLGGFALDRQKAISGARRFEDVEIGFVYEPPGGGIGFAQRDARDRSTVVATFTDSPAAGEVAPVKFDARTSQRDIVNRVATEVSPTLPMVALTSTQSGDTSAAAANDVSITLPSEAPHVDDAEVGDLVVVVVASSVQSDGVPWLNPTGWANLRPTFDEGGLTRIYAKKLNAGDFGASVLLYDDTAPAGGAWVAKLYLVKGWYGELASGLAVADPTGFGDPHTTIQANAGVNDPPSMLTPWGLGPALYIAARAGMVSSGSGATVAAADDGNGPDGYHSMESSFVNATAGSAYDVAVQHATRFDSTGISDPSEFGGDFLGFEYLETVTIAVRPFSGDPPPVSGGVEVVTADEDSQGSHGAVVDHPYPGTFYDTEASAAAAGTYSLDRFGDDRPIVTVGFYANSSHLHRHLARTLRLSDRVRITSADEGVDGDYHIEAIRGRLSDGDRLWYWEADCSPVYVPYPGIVLPDTDGLVLWHTTATVEGAGDTTIENKAARVVTTTVGDATLGTGTTRPTITVRTPTRIDLDGVNDFVTTDYTPTFTATTGELTVIVSGYWTSGMTSAAAERIVSFEDSDFDGMLIHSGPGSQAHPRVHVGGDSSTAFEDADGADLADGDRFVAAGIVDDGTLYAHLYGQDRSDGSPTTGVGTISFQPGQIGRRGNANSANSDWRMLDVLVFERAVGSDEFDEIAGLLITRKRPDPPAPTPGSSAGVASLTVAGDPTSAFSITGPPTVSNPIPGGGGTLLFIAAGQGPGNQPDSGASVTAPDAGAVEIFDYPGRRWLPRVRCWTLTEDSSASWSFGFGGTSDGRAFSMIVPLSGVAGSVTITPTPVATNGTSIAYPTISGIASDDLVLSLAVQQTTDELTAGPDGYSTVIDTTDATPTRIAVHSTIATDTTETPGNATWSGRIGGKVQLAVSFSNTANPTPETATATATAKNATVSLGELDVAATPTSAFSSSGPPTVSNPDSGTGNTFLFVAVGQGPGNEGSPTITAPDAGATQVFNYAAGGSSFVPRVRAWTFTEDGSTNWTFGFGGASDGRAFSLIVPLDGVAGTVTATATPTVASSTPRPYPTLSGIAADDLVLAVAVQQTTDELTGGPAGYTSEHNSTGSTPERVAVHSATATGSSETPGSSTWDGTAGAKVQWVIAFRSA